MTSTTIVPSPFAYVQCDVPEGQTLVAWRVEQDARRRAARRSRRPHLMNLFPRLRPAA